MVSALAAFWRLLPLRVADTPIRRNRQLAPQNIREIVSLGGALVTHRDNLAQTHLAVVQLLKLRLTTDQTHRSAEIAVRSGIGERDGAGQEV